MQELRSIYRARIHAWEVWLPSTPHWLLWLRLLMLDQARLGFWRLLRGDGVVGGRRGKGKGREAGPTVVLVSRRLS